MMEMIIEMDTRGCAFDTYWEQVKPIYRAHVDAFLKRELQKYSRAVVCSGWEEAKPETPMPAPSSPAKKGVSGSASSSPGVGAAGGGGSASVSPPKTPEVARADLSEPFQQFLAKFQLGDTQLLLLKVC
jgi:hypothetical protein